jgi:hypothetical protein
LAFPVSTSGINVPVYPQLVRVPGYPVYYAPQANANYFFYDGMYWVYQRDNWYASSWYNGPWHIVSPDAVPVYVLRVPVRYYRQPPAYFRSWSSNAAPRWGRALGQQLGAESSRLEQRESRLNAASGSAAGLPAAILGQSLSSAGAAAGPAGPKLPLPAEGCRRPAALSGATSASRAWPHAQGNPSKYEQKEAKREQKQAKARAETSRARAEASQARAETSHAADGPKGDKPEHGK